MRRRDDRGVRGPPDRRPLQVGNGQEPTPDDLERGRIEGLVVGRLDDGGHTRPACATATGAALVPRAPSSITRFRWASTWAWSSGPTTAVVSRSSTMAGPSMETSG